MKGIVLAGGTGTRLYPVTKVVSKHMLAVYDKPMIYYPLSVLMLSGIKEILIISTPEDTPLYKKLLDDGHQLGISIKYEVQCNPNGIGEAFIIGENFIKNDKVALVLGDNIFYGKNLIKQIKKGSELHEGAMIFGYKVDNPSCYGVAELNNEGNVITIQEKPSKPKSNIAVTGLYFYDNEVIRIAKRITKSKRGELEITSINEEYLKMNKLMIEIFDEEVNWFDAGTNDSLLESACFIKKIQKEQGIYIGGIEEIAYNLGFIDEDKFIVLIKELRNTQYGKYLTEKYK